MFFIQATPNASLSREAMLVKQYALMGNIQCYPYTEISKLNPNALRKAALIQGSVESITEALSVLGKPTPEPNYYPNALKEFIGRRIWKSTYGELNNSAFPLFIKSHDWKRLTGSVHAVKDDTLDTQMSVWCSEPVSFVAEWRVYVHHSQIIHAARYDENEDEDLSLNWSCIASAIQMLEVEQSRASYAFDWGLTDDGRTLLVENNDAWAIGAYGKMDYGLYTEFLISRWIQLTSS